MFCSTRSPNSSALAGTASLRPTNARISTISAIDGDQGADAGVGVVARAAERRVAGEQELDDAAAEHDEGEDAVGLGDAAGRLRGGVGFHGPATVSARPESFER